MTSHQAKHLRELEQAFAGIYGQLQLLKDTWPADFTFPSYEPEQTFVTKFAVAIELIDIHLSRAEDQTALLARSRGYSWEQVGHLFGMTRQAAHKRWSNAV